MPEFEFEFNQQDRDLVVTQSEGVVFGDSDISLDYIRLTIYPTEGINNIVDLADSTSGIDGKAIFFSSLDEAPFDVNISPFKEDNKFNTRLVGGSNNDFQIYKNTNGSIYIKPNEIFNTFELPQGNYRIQIDFLKQVLSGAPFIIKQISTSRKEIRLKVLNSQLSGTGFLNTLQNLFNDNIDGNNPEFLEDTDESSDTFGELVIPNPNYKYQFKHVLNLGNGDHIPIMNYAFDRFTDGADNQSIILKLYNDLPTNISNLKLITIEQEILTTQLQETQDYYHQYYH